VGFAVLRVAAHPLLIFQLSTMETQGISGIGSDYFIKTLGWFFMDLIRETNPKY
jgi:hypothetical protein